MRDSGVLGLVMSYGGHQRGWPAPEASVRRGEVRRGRKLGGKPAEVELTVKPRCQQWRLQIQRGGTMSGARDRSCELAVQK
jgi:hypothetical protein